MTGEFMQSRLLLVAMVVAMTGFTVSRSNHTAIYTSAPAYDLSASAAAPAAAAVAGDRDALVESALSALERSVVVRSHPEALRKAFNAYYSYKAAHGDEVHRPYLYFVDYGLNNRTPRGYVFDMENLKLVEGPFTVAHGRGSSAVKDAVPTRFSNRPGGAATSLGLYVTQETYGFSGHAGGRLYHSIGLRLKGVSGNFNSAARARGVVMHGAPYVTPSGAGRSEGCPAVEQARARRLIPMLANGSIVVLFSPRDTTWLNQDPWVSQ